MHFLSVTLLAFAAAAHTSTAEAPSFDCAAAEGASEKLVCTTPALSELDRSMAAVYATARAQASDRSSLAASQRNWLGQRRACMRTAKPRDCVTGSYRRRIAELQIQNHLVPTPPSFTWTCDGSSKRLTTAFYNSFDPPAAVLKFGGTEVVAFGTPTGSGSRYQAARVDYWEHQGVATVDFRGTHLTCHRTDRDG